MAKSNWKVLGIIATVAAGILSIATSMIDDKKQEERIEEAVSKEFDRRSTEESE